jgi:small subunit ribosomal protein S1
MVEGEVSSVTDFGIFVKVPGGIEGLIHKTNLPENRDETPEDALKRYNAGDKIKAVVLELQSDKQKVAFSINDYQKRVQQDEISRYMSGEESDDSTYTLGDFLKSKTVSDDQTTDQTTPASPEPSAEVSEGSAGGESAGE